MSKLFTVPTGPVCGMSNMACQALVEYFQLEVDDFGDGCISAKEFLKELEHADPDIITDMLKGYTTKEQVVGYLKLLTEMATLAAKDDEAVCWS